MSTATTGRDLALLPKAHLHVHLEAAVRRSTVDELAAASGLTAPALPAPGDFAAFAAAFLGMIPLLALPGALRRVVVEAAQDARAEGVVYLELGVSPQFYAAAYGSTQAALAELADAVVDARRTTGVEVGLMVTVDRTQPVAQAMELAELAARFADRGVASLGLANDEAGHPGAPFAAAFALAKAAGLQSTPHAGELAGAPSIAEAIDVLGADRLQHGVRILEDEALTQRVAGLEVCLDVCPTSNAFLGLVGDVANHPLPQLLDAGLACTINADDPTLLGVTLLDEYRICREAIGLSDEQLAACARTSVRYSWASKPTVHAALAGIDAWLALGPGEARA
jgi:adenosine deaminase